MLYSRVRASSSHAGRLAVYIPHLVERGTPLHPRLIERLNEALSAGRTPGVTLISAPAGFGKTTLVSEWVHQKDEGRR